MQLSTFRKRLIAVSLMFTAFIIIPTFTMYDLFRFLSIPEDLVLNYAEPMMMVVLLFLLVLTTMAFYWVFCEAKSVVWRIALSIATIVVSYFFVQILSNNAMSLVGSPSRIIQALGTFAGIYCTGLLANLAYNRFAAPGSRV